MKFWKFIEEIFAESNELFSPNTDIKLGDQSELVQTNTCNPENKNKEEHFKEKVYDSKQKNIDTDKSIQQSNKTDSNLKEENTNIQPEDNLKEQMPETIESSSEDKKNDSEEEYQDTTIDKNKKQPNYQPQIEQFANKEEISETQNTNSDITKEQRTNFQKSPTQDSNQTSNIEEKSLGTSNTKKDNGLIPQAETELQQTIESSVQNLNLSNNQNNNNQGFNSRLDQSQSKETTKEDLKEQTLEREENQIQNITQDLSHKEKNEGNLKEGQQSQNKEDTPPKRKESLQKLKDKIEEYQNKKQKIEETKTKPTKEKLNNLTKESIQSEEQHYELSEQTNKFLNQLSELPSFENRDRGAGYSIDTESYTEIPDSVIRTLITKFLNQRFCKRNTDLNVRSNSLEKSKGFYKWEVKDVIIHLETEQIMKVLNDKYGYEYTNGKNEFVPLSFYFDMSGSMSSYTNMLAVIAIELLKKNVKVLIGFNERVNVQIESINKNIDIKTLAEILESAGYYSVGYRQNYRENFIKDPRVNYKYIAKNLDNYLLDKKAEKCVVFSDFDPYKEIINLSQKVQVYWFCFENNFYGYNLTNYNGFIYKVQNIKDIQEGLIKVNEKRFETLVYTDNPKTLRKKLGG